MRGPFFLVVVALLSCSSVGTPAAADETFLAFGTSFAGYPSWESWLLATAENPEDGGVRLDDAGCTAGHDTSAEYMQRARQAILAHGGADAVNSYTRYFPALLGQISYEQCPAVPPEMDAPQQAPGTQPGMQP